MPRKSFDGEETPKNTEASGSQRGEEPRDPLALGVWGAEARCQMNRGIKSVIKYYTLYSES